MTEKAFCSFCGKSQEEVTKIIAGPSVFICDECVALCAAIIIAEPVEKKKVGRYYISTNPPLDVGAIADRLANKLFATNKASKGESK